MNELLKFSCNSEAFALELSSDIDSTTVCYHTVSYIITGERKEVMSSSYNSEAPAMLALLKSYSLMQA